MNTTTILLQSVWDNQGYLYGVPGMLNKFKRKTKKTQTETDSDVQEGDSTSSLETSTNVNSQFLPINLDYLLNRDTHAATSPPTWLEEEIDSPYPSPTGFFDNIQIGDLHTRTHRSATSY